MIKLELKKYEYDLEMPQVHGFENPIVFYKYHTKDPSRFFLLFSIVEISRKKITHLVSRTSDNITIMENQDRKRYTMHYAPHCTIDIRKGIDFLVFLQEESYFFYINYQDCYMLVYTMEDLLRTDTLSFKTISSTFFKDDQDNRYFYLAALAMDKNLYVYRISNNLEIVEPIDAFPGKKNPPHTVRKYKDCLLFSHEFTEAKYYLQKTNTIITDREMGSLLTKLQIKIDRHYPDKNKYEKKKILSRQIREKYDVRCIPSKIMLEDLRTKERVAYETSGSNSAHFEIDSKTDMIYVSSHNFFEGDGYIYMFQPAVLDKYEYAEGRLIWRGCFTYDKGYRYTSHKVFYIDGKAYMCTFSKPNRLLIIDPDTMTLLHYTDIGKDELTNTEDLTTYLNARHEDTEAGSEFIGMEVSTDGESIFFLDDYFLFIYNVRRREVSHQIPYRVNELQDSDDYRLISPHITYLV